MADVSANTLVLSSGRPGPIGNPGPVGPIGPVGPRGPAPLSYSTLEQYTGQLWVNSRPIYQITIHYPSLPGVFVWRYDDHGIPNVDEMVSGSGIGLDTANTYYPIPFWHTGGGGHIGFYITRTQLVWSVGNIDRSNMQAWMTLYYTCTDR